MSCLLCKFENFREKLRITSVHRFLFLKTGKTLSQLHQIYPNPKVKRSCEVQTAFQCLSLNNPLINTFFVLIGKL